MKNPVRLRMTEFLIAVTAVIAVILVTERSAWQQITRLREHLGPQALSQARSADRLRRGILEVNDTRRVSLEAANAASLAAFERASQNFEALLDTELHRAASPQEKAALENLVAEYHAASGQPPSPDKHQAGPGVETGARLSRLLGFCEELGLANQAAEDALLNKARANLARLQQFLFVSLAVLLVCGTVVLILTYRHMVRPLRSSLAESRMLIERQEKLASLGCLPPASLMKSGIRSRPSRFGCSPSRAVTNRTRPSTKTWRSSAMRLTASNGSCVIFSNSPDRRSPT